jgi:TrmH family RNA methyltransferase
VTVQISSADNPKVKELCSLHRRSTRYSERRYLIEGVRLVEEALQSGVSLQLVLYVAERLQEPSRAAALLARLTTHPHAFSTTPQILDRAAETVTPQGVVAAVPFSTLAPAKGLVLILDQLRDPGNCGTILRTAEAAGAGLVLCTPGTVDPFSPKAVRAGMGAHFRLPLRVAASWDAIAEAVAGRQVLLAEACGDRPYDGVDWRLPTALIVGGEAEGPSPEARHLADATVSIPMAAGTESLNAAVAAGILLFEAARQRHDEP